MALYPHHAVRLWTVFVYGAVRLRLELKRRTGRTPDRHNEAEHQTANYNRGPNTEQGFTPGRTAVICRTGTEQQNDVIHPNTEQQSLTWGTLCGIIFRSHQLRNPSSRTTVQWGTLCGISAVTAEPLLPHRSAIFLGG
eukprot:m.394684 g.394684  ORF g.394684 m.394684 type:complete len:138 (-) comp16767_c0_seq23:121-534(-)